MLAGALCFVAAVMVLRIGASPEEPEQGSVAPAAQAARP